ncbi:MAG: hypothetical protein QM523_08325 [Candidatus Pacebacteria bacterium]|nr:hypothetical protein [Candidatus Paceibacterota bacterium]
MPAATDSPWLQLAQTKITPLDAAGSLEAPIESPIVAGQLPPDVTSSALPAPLTKKAAQANKAEPEFKAKTNPNPPSKNTQAKPAKPAKSDSGQNQNLAIRIGSHSGFVRLVFDWTTVTNYTLRKEANAVFINFSHNAQVDLDRVYAALPRSIGVFESGVELNNLVVAFTVPQGARIRDSKFGHLIIVDVMTPDNSVAQKIKTRLLPPMINDPKLEVRARVSPPPPSPPPSPQTPPQSSPAANDNSPPKPIAAVPAEVYSKPLGSDSTIPNPVLQPLDSTDTEVTVFRLVTPDITSLRFVFPAETGLAAFERGEFLYVVFDRPARFNFSALGKDAPPNWMTPQRLGPDPTAEARRSTDLGTGSMAQRPDATAAAAAKSLAPGIPEAIALDSGSGIRLKIPKGWQVQISKPIYPSPTANGSGKTPAQTPGVAATANQYWAVDFVRTPLRHSDLRVTNDEGNGNGGGGKKPKTALQIATVGARSVIAVTVPELDRPLLVVPLSMVARGIMTDRHYPQFTLASSWQGLVVEPVTDGVRVTPKGESVLVESAAGAAFLVQTLPINSLFDFSYLVKKDSDYVTQRQRLQQLIVESNGDEKNHNRFNLAQFFIANSHAADALGILDILAREKSNSTNLGNDPAVKALRGLARVLMNDGKAASLDLSDSRLNGIPAIGWWRGAALAIEEEYKSADLAFTAAGAIPTSYPSELKAMLLQYAAESAFGVGNAARARSLFFGFPVAIKNPSLSNRVDYLKAQLLLSKNDEVDDRLAMTILDRLVKDGNAWGRAHGEWARIQFQLKKGKLPVDQAIIRLERLQYSWSGSEMQFRILAQLGDLYFDQLQPREGLKRLRQAVQYFPYHPDRETVKAHLINRFVALYSDKASERIPPLAALAVYDDNRDLTPLDERGDLMIQKLADRLVEIDLLDRAADLLTYQVQQRLKGSERSRVGARLAAIQLLDKKPQEAMVSLDLSDVPDVSNDLRKQRQLLQARAMLRSGKPEPALRALDGFADRDADLVRAEIFAEGKQWSRLAEVMARLVGRPVPGVMLDESQQQLLLNLAIALVMAGDNGSVRKLNSDFIALMPDGDAKNTFIVLTSGDGLVGGIDAAALNLRFSELGQFKQAMNSLARITEVKK